MNSLITLPLRSKRDLLVARQRARQIAVLLHFEPDDQACIAAGAFTVAAEALRNCGTCDLCMQIENHSLHVFARVAVSQARPATIGFSPEQRSLRLVKQLPECSIDIAGEDLSWLAAQLSENAALGHGSFSLYDEVRNQNQEILALLSALREARSTIERLQANAIAA